MSAGKVSGVFRQSKGGRATSGGKRKGAPAAAAGLRRSEEPEEDRETARLLLLFDLTSKFGPCTGLTRLERWERAQKLGLQPPQAVKDLIEAAEGEEREQLNRSTWEGRGI